MRLSNKLFLRGGSEVGVPLEQISQITHGVVLNRIKPKILSEGAEYPILTISQLIDEENGVWDYEVPTALVDKKGEEFKSGKRA